MNKFFIRSTNCGHSVYCGPNYVNTFPTHSAAADFIMAAQSRHSSRLRHRRIVKSGLRKLLANLFLTTLQGFLLYFSALSAEATLTYLVCYFLGFQIATVISLIVRD